MTLAHMPRPASADSIRVLNSGPFCQSTSNPQFNRSMANDTQDNASRPSVSGTISHAVSRG